MIETITELTDTLKESLLQDNENANVEKSERILSLASGSFVFIKGIGNLFSHPTLALGELIIGGMLVYRGVTGVCPIKQMADGPVMQAPDAILITTTEYSGNMGASGSSQDNMGASDRAAGSMGSNSTGSMDRPGSNSNSGL